MVSRDRPDPGIRLGTQKLMDRSIGPRWERGRKEGGHLACSLTPPHPDTPCTIQMAGANRTAGPVRDDSSSLEGHAVPRWGIPE